MTELTNTDIRRARVGGEMTPGKLAFKLLKLILDTHIKLDPATARLIPVEAWTEIEHRLRNLQMRIDTFIEAR